MKMFQRIVKICKHFNVSQHELGEQLGLNGRTFLGYLNGKREHNLWVHLTQILALYPSISRSWLYFGEGEMLGTDPATHKTPPVPLVGLASCGVHGLEQIMPFAVTVSPIALSNKSVAVVASGESMVPAGIASGHVCYCDPEQEPLAGEAVFLRRKDGLGALKLFLGRGEREGSLLFKGWLPPDDKGNRKEFLIDVEKVSIDSIAPVIFVRRRL